MTNDRVRHGSARRISGGVQDDILQTLAGLHGASVASRLGLAADSSGRLLASRCEPSARGRTEVCRRPAVVPGRPQWVASVGAGYRSVGSRLPGCPLTSLTYHEPTVNGVASSCHD